MDVKPFARGELDRLVDQLKGASLREGNAELLRQRKPTVQRQADGSPAARIKRLLIVEAGSSLQQSVQELQSELSKVGFAVANPGRTSFQRWLDELLKSIPAGEVLNAAMTVAARHKAE